MALSDGDAFVSGDIFSYQQANRMKDNWRAASAVSSPQAGMLFSDSDDNKLYHYNGSAWLEITQGGLNSIIADNIQLIFGSDSDASIEYDEADDDLWKFGVPVSNDTLAILQAADVGQDLASIPSYSNPTLALYGASYTDYLALYHDETDAYFRTLDGSFVFQTDEGTNTITNVKLIGKGTEGTTLQLVDADDDSTFQIDMDTNDDEVGLALPSGGAAFRTTTTDTDNAGLIKVAKVSVAASALTAAAATDNENVAAIPANSLVLSAKYVLDTQFAGGSVSDVDCTIGLAGDDNGLIAPAAHNLTSDAVGTEYTTKGAYWDGSDSNLGTYHATSATTWVAYFTAVDDTWDNIGTGQITFYIMYVDCQGT